MIWWWWQMARRIFAQLIVQDEILMSLHWSCWISFVCTWISCVYIWISCLYMNFLSIFEFPVYIWISCLYLNFRCLLYWQENHDIVASKQLDVLKIYHFYVENSSMILCKDKCQLHVAIYWSSGIYPWQLTNHKSHDFWIDQSGIWIFCVDQWGGV